MPVADPAATLRPSIETSLHALLPHRVVLHVHAVNTIAWASCLGVDKEMAERLEGLAWARVPYRRPGLPLSQVVAETLAQRRPDVLILGNHGLLVGAADCAAAEALVHEVERRLYLPVRPRRRAMAPRSKRCAAAPTIARGDNDSTISPPIHVARDRDQRLALSGSRGVPGSRLARAIRRREHRDRPPPTRQPDCRRRSRCWRRAPARSCGRTSSPAPRRC